MKVRWNSGTSIRKRLKQTGLRKKILYLIYCVSIFCMRLSVATNGLNSNIICRMHDNEVMILLPHLAGLFQSYYSNCFASKYAGIKSIGVIRGERPRVLSRTLEQAMEAGMELDFVSRSIYSDKASIMQQLPGVYWVNEGGFGIRGAEGAAEILQYNPHAFKYTHIACAVGTGTMMAGLIIASTQKQQVIGISAMKGNLGLEQQRYNRYFRYRNRSKNFHIFHDYHFGGYAKHPPELIHYMNQLWEQHRLPTDIVYTAKTFYAVEQMVNQSLIPPGSKILMIHSGGLQGNRSLPDKTLAF